MKRLLLASACALGLAGCLNESADLGAPPPVVLATTHVVVTPLSRSGGITRTQLGVGVRAVAEGQPQAVRADIQTRTPRQAEAIRRTLVAFGLDPAHLSLQSIRPGDSTSSRVILTHRAAGTAPCATAIRPDYPDNPLPSLMSLAQCNQNNNLADMLVDPSDLVAPSHLGRGDGAYLADGVRSWRANRSLPIHAQGASAAADTGSEAAAPASASTAAASPAVNTVPSSSQATVTQ